jgi:hypothetical protein
MTELHNDFDLTNHDDTLDGIEEEIDRLIYLRSLAAENCFEDLEADITGALLQARHWLLLATMAADGHLRRRIAVLGRRIDNEIGEP